MTRAAAFLLIMSLAACAKPAPPAAVAASPVPAAKPAPAEKAGGEVAPVQTPVPAKPAAPAAAAAPAPAAPMVPPPAAPAPVGAVKDGETLYADNCATCHMADGNGVPFMQPAIKGSAWISNPNPQLLLSLILRGATVMGEAANAWDNKMPPVDNLSDAEIAAVATYVRSHFAAGPITVPVTPDQVAVARSRPGLPQ